MHILRLSGIEPLQGFLMSTLTFKSSIYLLGYDDHTTKGIISIYDWFDWLIFCVLTPLSAIFQLYHGDQFQWWGKPEYPERTTDHGQATGKLYHLRLWVECTLFCDLQSRARTHPVLLIGLYELLDPTT
jgi:hypothetical protein